MGAVAPKLDKQTKSRSMLVSCKEMMKTCFYFGGRGGVGKASVADGWTYWLWWNGNGWVCILFETSVWQRSAVLTEADGSKKPNMTLLLQKWLAPSLQSENSAGQKPSTALTRSVVKGSCVYVAGAARPLQQPIAPGTYSSSQVTLSKTTQWRNDSTLVRVYMTLFHSKQTI